MKGDLEDIEVYSSFTGGFSWDAKEAWGLFAHFFLQQGRRRWVFSDFCAWRIWRMSAHFNFFIPNLKSIREMRSKIICVLTWSCFQQHIYVPAQTKAEGLQPLECDFYDPGESQSCKMTSWPLLSVVQVSLIPSNRWPHGNLMEQQLLTKPNSLLPEGKKLF